MPSRTAFEDALRVAHDAALDYLDSLPGGPVDATATLGELRARLARPLNDPPLDATEVVRDLVRDTAGGLVGSAGGRFFAWAIGGAVPAALAADWLTSAWDQNAGLYASGPAAAVVEEVAGDWLKELLAIPRSASFAFVSGCQMAHVTCLAAARHGVLAERGWDVERSGLAGAPPIRILASNRHGSVERAVRFLGMGTDHIAALELDAACRTTPDALRAALAAAPDTPAIVLLQAGDINTGAFEDYRALIPIAREYRAWVHIDGAFGLWAAASPRYRHLLAGADHADSWATDGHKWLNVPYDSGYAFVTRRDAHQAAMSHRASYLVHDAEARDQMDWNPEWSRRARGFPTYAAIRQLGRAGMADLVDRCCAYARALVEGIGRLEGAEAVWPPVIAQGLVRFHAPEGDDDVFTDAIVRRVLASGEAFFQGTTWRGQRAMRVSVLNWQTTQDDIDRAVAAVARALAAER